MKLNEAQAEYPSAWLLIQQRMAELEKMTDAVFIPIAAAITDHNGERVLRILTHTDLIEHGSESDHGMFAFQAPLDGMPADAMVH